MRKRRLLYLLFALAALLSAVASPALARSEQGEGGENSVPSSFESGADPMEELRAFVTAHPMRAAGTEGEAQAADWLAARYASMGYLPLEGESMLREFQLNSVKSQNVLAYRPAVIAGRVRELDDPETKFVILSAHYDNASEKMLAGYQGAYDNGSGVAALLAAAENLKGEDVPFHLVIANFGAEEKGLYGSRAFLNEFADRKGRILLAVNLDVVGGGKNLYLYTDEVQTSYDGYIREIAAREGVELTPNPANKKVMLMGFGKFPYSHVGMLSDNSAFAAEDIPTAFFFSYDWGDPAAGLTEGNEQNIMHTQLDNLDHLNPAAALHMRGASTLICALLGDERFVYEMEHVERMNYDLLINGNFGRGMAFGIVVLGVLFVVIRALTFKKPPAEPGEEREIRVFDDFE